MSWEVLAHGYRLAEAPTIDRDGSLLFSDVLGGGVYRRRATDDDVATVVPKRRGVGGIAPRRLLCGAKQPPYRTRWTRGKGTKVTSFSKSSPGGRVIPVVPSD